MSTLTCHTLGRGDYRLTVEPVPVVRGMADPHQYAVRLERSGHVLHEAKISVAGSPEGHFFVYVLVNAFRRCDLLVHRDIGFKLWTPGYEDPGYGAREPAALLLEALGLSFALTGHIAYGTKEPRIHAALSILEKPSLQTGLTPCQRLEFYAPVPVVKAFGEALYNECANAARLRQACFEGDATNDPFAAALQ